MDFFRVSLSHRRRPGSASASTRPFCRSSTRWVSVKRSTPVSNHFSATATMAAFTMIPNVRIRARCAAGGRARNAGRRQTDPEGVENSLDCRLTDSSAKSIAVRSNLNVSTGMVVQPRSRGRRDAVLCYWGRARCAVDCEAESLAVHRPVVRSSHPETKRPVELATGRRR